MNQADHELDLAELGCGDLAIGLMKALKGECAKQALMGREEEP